jgi:hypothetical protein
MAPSNKSPPDVVVVFPLLAAVLFPCAVTLTSSEFAVANPEYSNRANRNVPVAVSDTVMVFAPPAMFSA